jgi:hypothetical protein
MTHALRKAFRLFVGVLFLGLIWSSQPSTAASLDGESGTLSLLSPNTTTLVAGPIPFVVGGPASSTSEIRIGRSRHRATRFTWDSMTAVAAQTLQHSPAQRCRSLPPDLLAWRR